MGKSLMGTSKSFSDHINNLNRISVAQGFPSFKGFIDSSPTDTPKIQNSPIVAQMALVCLEIAIARLWMSWGVLPSAVIGHSLGEYAALNIAGVLSDYDTIYLVGTRARLMQLHCQPGTHSMLAVRGTVDKNELAMICLQNDVEVACWNSPRDAVLSGLESQIEKVQAIISSTMKTQRLEVPFAFHSSQVDPILDRFESSCASTVFSPPKIPIISPLLGKTVLANDKNHPFTPSYLRKHCREAVNFVSALKNHIGSTTGSDQAKTTWLEVGPHPACSSMIKGTFGGGPTVASLSKSQDPYTTLVSGISTLYGAGKDINWGEYHRDFESCLAVLPLPSYAFEEKKFWIDYKNDWTLTKGEETQSTSSVVSLSPSTTTVQKIISQNLNGSKATVVAETSFSNPQLRAAVAGHLINGVGMCPSAIYADMALTLSQYSLKLLGHSIENVHLNVRDMANSSPLIIELSADAKPQTVEIEAESDLSKKSTQIIIRSKNLEKTIEYTKCVVTIEDESDWGRWSRVEHLIKSRIDVLTESSNVSKIQEGMAYKLFSNLVQYGSKYRGMREVFLDSEALEATARVSCRSTGEDGTFSMSPYLIDNMAHISGFVMNANDSLDVNHIYISHGWESMRFKEPLSLGATYQVYVKMLPLPGSKMVAGDVYVLHDSKIVGVVAQCRFQWVPQSLLSTLLPSRKNLGGATSSPLRTVAQEYTAPLQAIDSPAKFQAIPVIQRIIPLENITNQVVSVLADEIGCDISELTDSTLFTDLGVDSLLSLAILGKLREEVDLEVDSTLFLEHTSVGSLKRYLNDLFPAPKSLPPEASISTPFSSHRSSTSTSTINSTSNSDGTGSAMSSVDSSRPGSATVTRVNSHSELKSSTSDSHLEVRSQSVLLQGSPKAATRNVFLLPDGSGSATSYALLPPLSRDICVWGLNCPFMTSPENFTIGVPAIVKIYLAEIKARQPIGPYILGGWSAGGVLAYETTRQLLAEGETVDTLLLIDSPFPLGLEALPSSFHRFCAKIGLLSSEANIPGWLLPHFAATVRELTKYSAELEKLSLPNHLIAKMPKTVAIWAVDGVIKGQNETPEWEGRMPNSMQWLVEDRSDLGPNGWESLVGDENVTCLNVEGNHFTMMREPIVSCHPSFALMSSLMKCRFEK
jgi:naphtho-gamma-pyrone polyketide synthase